MSRFTLFLILLSSTFIGGCIADHTFIIDQQSSSSIASHESSLKGLQMSAWSDFSVVSPLPFKERIVRDDGSIAFTTFDTSTVERAPTDFSVHLYQFSDSRTCSTTLTGTSHPEPIPNTNGMTAWGRMDAWDGYGGEGWEWPDGWENVLCTKSGTPSPAEIYTLCSDKNGKTVVMCVNQMTDNPSLAKQIFDTFKWTN